MSGMTEPKGHCNARDSMQAEKGEAQVQRCQPTNVQALRFDEDLQIWWTNSSGLRE